MTPEQLDRLWTPENLENLARTYWAYLEKISLGLIRIRYSPGAREIVLLRRPLVLLRFHKPDYEFEGERGTVTWRIERGLLVWPWGGRDKGFLRLTLRCRHEGERAVLRIQSEVAHFYPTLALPGLGLLSRIGRALYRASQLRMHVLITHGFLRSLASLELEESQVGALRQLPAPAPEAPPREPVRG